jgi:hypothetical protein
MPDQIRTTKERKKITSTNGRIKKHETKNKKSFKLEGTKY